MANTVGGGRPQRQWLKMKISKAENEYIYCMKFKAKKVATKDGHTLAT
jgi:hypothetical protein